MCFDQLPNELIVQIFTSLSIKDLHQCSMVSSRFHNVITRNLRHFYIDDWRVNSKLARKISEYACTPDSLVALCEDGSVDVFEWSSCNRTRLFRTAASVSGALHDYRSLLAAIPNSRVIVYVMQESRMVVFDLATSQKRPIFDPIAETFTPNHRNSADEIVCSSEAIAVLRMIDGVDGVHIYSWNGGEARLSQILPLLPSCTPSISISTGGLLAFEEGGTSRFRLYDAHSLRDFGSVDVGSRRGIRHLQVSANGTRLAVAAFRLPEDTERDIEDDLIVYDVSKLKIGQISIVFQSAQGASFLTDTFLFASDSVILMMSVLDDHIAHIRIFDQKREVDDEDVEFRVDLPKMAIGSCLFRELNGRPHLQLVTESGRLKLYRL